MGERLTALDATFLELEQLDEGATMHIGSVMVFEPLPDGAAPSIEQVRGHMRTRLATLPRYSQRLSSERTGGLGWPRWEDNPRFEIANHVRSVALPSPGGDAELFEWAGDFFSHRLDRTRPLWEVALVEGLDGGRWALATKTHHALVDGVGSVGVGQVMLDAERTPTPEPVATPSDAPPSSLWDTLLPRAPGVVADLVSTGARAARAGLHAAAHPREAFESARSLGELLVRDELVAAPRTSINVPTGAAREYAVVRTSLAELKEIGHGLGGSVNDVLLAACTAGLRRLLLARAEAPPAAGLRAMVPTNLRADSERLALGNRVSSLFVELPVAEPDALERLRTVAAATRRLKDSGAAVGASAMIDLAALAPPVLHSLIGRSLYAKRLFNITITNVPGPQFRLYAFGAALEEIHPYVPLAAEHALGIAIVSYDGGLTLGLCADRDSTADLHVLVEGIEAGLKELRQLRRGGSLPASGRRQAAGLPVRGS
jgi:WS/DGAT/MGAT family acyltransferase